MDEVPLLPVGMAFFVSKLRGFPWNGKTLCMHYVRTPPVVSVFRSKKSAVNSRAHLYRLFLTLAFLLNLEFNQTKDIHS